MSSKTTNYNLHKIDLNDSPPDITVLNQNFDILDEKLNEKYGDDNKPTVADIGAVNPNLLDNWFFIDPVNQRGQTQYSGHGYTIDRWMTDGVATVSNGISSTQPFYQIVKDEVIKALLGKVVTLSAMDAGNLVSCTYRIPDSLPNQYVTLEKLYGDEILQIVLCSGDQSQLYRFGAGVNNILAVKAEIGSVQTLAYQDAEGKWTLNEIPSYAEQMAICKQYDPITGEYIGYPFVTCDTPIKLRVTADGILEIVY